jgi:hypothetical protein
MNHFINLKENMKKVKEKINLKLYLKKMELNIKLTDIINMGKKMVNLKYMMLQMGKVCLNIIFKMIFN